MSRKKHHISTSGEPAECVANIRTCPRSAEATYKSGLGVEGTVKPSVREIGNKEIERRVKELIKPFKSFEVYDKAFKDTNGLKGGNHHKANEGRSLTNVVALLRRVWDGFFKDPNYPKEKRVLTRFANVFPNYEECAQYKPFGEAKDHNNMSHKEIFSIYMDKLTEIKTVGDRKSNLLIVWWNTMKKNGLTVDYDKFAISAGMYMYILSRGVSAEGKVSREIPKLLPSGYRFKEASSEVEGDGIDGYIYKGNELSNIVSIKTLGALTPTSIGMERTNNGRTKPDLYIGYKEIDSKNLSFLDINGEEVLLSEVLL